MKLNVGHKTKDSDTELDEEEKARLLLGDRHLVSKLLSVYKSMQLYH